MRLGLSMVLVLAEEMVSGSGSGGGDCEWLGRGLGLVLAEEMVRG